MYDDQALKVGRQEACLPETSKAARDRAIHWVSRAGCCSTENGHTREAEDAERRRAGDGSEGWPWNGVC